MQYKHKLRELREQKQFSQKKIGELLGITQQQYGLYETNQRSMPIELYIKLSKIYNVSIDYMVGLKDEEKGKLP